MKDYNKKPTDLDIKTISKKYKDEMLALYKKSSSSNSNKTVVSKDIPVMALPQETPSTLLSITAQSTPGVTSDESTTENFSGKLTIKVTTANGMIPVEEAFIQVYQVTSEGNVLYNILSTDRNGIAPTISLPTTNPALNQVPGQRGGFKDYVISVYKKGYERVNVEDVPIFAGVSSFQNVDLIPIPTLTSVPEEIEIDIPEPEL